jgi:hypothetical protein
MRSTSFPGQLLRTRRFTLGVPEQFTVALDGAAVLFLRGRPAGRRAAARGAAPARVGHQAMGVAITEPLLWHQVRFLQRHLTA